MSGGAEAAEAAEEAPPARPPHLLVFQMCTVSWSQMPCCAACSSSRSKKYLTGRGAGRPALRITWNRSSTKVCRVPCGDRAGSRRGGQRGALASSRPWP